MGPLQTERGMLASRYVQVMYAPLMPLQIFFGYLLWNLTFMDLPAFYLGGFGLLISMPCFVFWCCCAVVASRYGRSDFNLAQLQRKDRGKKALEGGQLGDSEQTITAMLNIADLTESS